MSCLKYLAGLGLAILLTSCLGIDSTYTMNDNGSGTIAFHYRISKMFTSLGKGEGDAARPALPLPGSRQELEKTLGRAKGVTLSGVEQTEDSSDIFIKGEIRFDSVAALNKSGLFDDMPIALTKDGARTTFTQLLTDTREPIDKETLDAYRQFFDGYDIVFRIAAPRPITAAGPGELSADKRTLTYKISLLDFVQLTQKTEVRASW